jgi:CxxC motif-containing protein
MGEIVTVRYLCIGCPLGCRLEVDEDLEEHAIVEVRGFSCRRGKEYAIQEHTAPQRMVTTTVAIDKARWARLPVRTSRPAPKDKVLEICRALRTVRVSAPIASGDIIVRNILDTGVDIIATRDMAEWASPQNIEA